MKLQKYSWSCGPASVSNALSCFGIHVPEAQVAPVAGCVTPSRCSHCIRLKQLVKARTCSKAWRTCKCQQCKDIRSANRKPCQVGTTEDGVLAALRHFGNGALTASSYTSNNQNEAWQWLNGCLVNGRAAILAISNWGHWCVAIGVLGDKVIIFDPMADAKGIKENGVFIWHKSLLMKNWAAAAEEDNLFAISVGRS